MAKPILTQFGNFRSVMNTTISQMNRFVGDEAYQTVAGVEIQSKARLPHLKYQEGQAEKNELIKKLQQELNLTAEQALKLKNVPLKQLKLDLAETYKNKVEAQLRQRAMPTPFDKKPGR